MQLFASAGSIFLILFAYVQWIYASFTGTIYSYCLLSMASALLLQLSTE